MAEKQETFSDLVRAQVGDGRPMTYREFHRRAVDPETGYRPSTTTIQRIIEEKTIKINPSLVRAIAAGLGRSSREVGVAAHRQYIGTELETWDPFPGEHPSDVIVSVTGVPGATADDMPLTLGHLKRILAEIEERKAAPEQRHGDEAAEA